MIFTHRRWSTALLFSCLFAGAHLAAQTESASLRGTVRDPQGEPVPGAEVQVRRLETNAVATSDTNGDGVYAFTALPPGHYQLTVRKQGFKEIVTAELVLAVPDRVERDFALEIGSVSEKVTVEAGASIGAYIDGNTGELKKLFLPRGPGGNTFTNLIVGLHFADFRGWQIYRFVEFVSGFLIAMLSVTGVYIWWRKRGVRRKSSRRAYVVT